jgi:hydroxylamine reductase (hybrid-cluster protein)
MAYRKLGGHFESAARIAADDIFLFAGDWSRTESKVGGQLIVQHTKTILKTEKKSPVVHVVVGKVSQSIEELTANVNELINVVKSNKIKKLALCATMGPCVKVEIK